MPIDLSQLTIFESHVIAERAAQAALRAYFKDETGFKAFTSSPKYKHIIEKVEDAIETVVDSGFDLKLIQEKLK